MFHDIQERFGGLQLDTHCLASSPYRHRAVGLERGRFIPTAPLAIEPLTPLSPLPLRGRLERLRAPSARHEEAAKVALNHPLVKGDDW